MVTSLRSYPRQGKSVPTEYMDEKDHRRQLARAINDLLPMAAVTPVGVPGTISAAYTQSPADLLILGNGTGGANTVTLMSAVGQAGRRVIVKKTDTTGNAIIVDGEGAETIDGQATRTLNVQNEGVEVISDGANWRVVSGRALTLGLGNTEMGRVVDNSGVLNLLLGVTSAINSGILQVLSAAAAGITVQLSNSHATVTTGKIINLNFSGDTPDDNTAKFLEGADATTTRIIIYSDGDVQNHDNSYGAISDETLKQDVAPASSQWDDIKALSLKNFRFKSDVALGKDKVLLGCLAQDVESISPGLVTNSVDEKTGEAIKGIKYSILYMKAVGALQEAMARIEALEAKAK